MMTQPESTLLAWSDTIATYGMLAAGMVHVGLTPRFKPTLDEDALWFAGTGFGLCCLAGMNIMQLTTANPATRWFTRAANVSGTGYMLVLARTLPAPHVYTVLAFVAVATLNSFIRPTNEQPFSQQI